MIRQTLTLPKLQLSYLEWNQGKKPLILLHGLADLALIWKSLGEYLAPDYHIVAPDLRGHGESSKPSQGYTFKEIIDDLEALMEHLGWSSAHILGHSWSGKLAAIWATQNPERFQSLILVDPFFIGTMPSWDAYAVAYAIELTFPLLYRVLPFLKMMGPFPSYEAAEKVAKELKQYKGWSPLQQQVFAAGLERKPDGTWGSKFVLQARNEIFADVMKVEGLTKPLTTPTLFIKPASGLNRTPWQLKPYQTYLTNLQVRQVPGHHWPFLVQPSPFNRTVAEFLACV